MLKELQVVQFSAQSDIFGKITSMQQNRNIDLKEVFCYPLEPITWALATCNGKLMKTKKSKLMQELVKGDTSVEKVDAPYVSIFDGMAHVRMLKSHIQPVCR